MSDALLQLIIFAFMVTWFGVGVVLYFRSRVKLNAYLRRFEHEIDFFAGDPIFFPGSLRAYRDGRRVLHEQQPDPEAEQLRLDMWRRFRYYLIWVFGFPAIFVGVAVILILLLWHPPQ
jgi:hypothetical protein